MCSLAFSLPAATGLHQWLSCVSTQVQEVNEPIGLVILDPDQDYVLSKCNRASSGDVEDSPSDAVGAHVILHRSSNSAKCAQIVVRSEQHSAMVNKPLIKDNSERWWRVGRHKRTPAFCIRLRTFGNARLTLGWA